MTDTLLAAAIGWLSPLAAFGLYTLIHVCRPRRPLSSPQAFFIEVARRK